MNLKLVIGSLLVACALSLCSSLVRAQSPEPAPAQSPDIVRENDRLPFMNGGETAEEAEPSSATLVLKTIGSMLLIIALIFGAAWGAKKFGLTGGRVADEKGPELTLVSSLNLGNGRTISTVRFGERILVVGSTAQSFTLLAEEGSVERMSFDKPRSVAELLEQEGASFGDEFARATAEQEARFE